MGQRLTLHTGVWTRLLVRWRIWRRDPVLLEWIARGALSRMGVCDESDSVLRFARDRASGRLIVIVYLAHFDHAVWALSRHIESYLVRQFKGLYGIPVHSVHIGVVRNRAFKETPAANSAVAMRALLRERRRSGTQSTARTGTRIRHEPPQVSDDAFAPTRKLDLEPVPAPASRPGVLQRFTDPARNRMQDELKHSIHANEYLSIPGYEVSEIDFEEFLSSMPADGHSVSGQKAAPFGPAGGGPADSKTTPAPAAGSPFAAETDVIQHRQK